MNRADLVAFALSQLELDMEDRGSDDDMDALQCQIDLVDYALSDGDKAKFRHDDDDGTEFTDNELKRYRKVLTEFEVDGIPWQDGEVPRLENPGQRANLPHAEKLYSMWHQKDPHEVLEANVQFPAQVACIGEATQTCYGSDKWHKDGELEEYFHDHDGNVKVYMADPDADVDTRKILRVQSLQGELAMPILAETREITFRMANGKKRTLRFTDAPMLCCTPDKKTLVIFSQRLGPILIRGGKMLVTKRGIVG